MAREYQICSRCIMDTTDEEIQFDEQGVCNYCRTFDTQGRPVLERSHSEHGKKMLSDTIGKIKATGRDRDYDCIVGLSGGVDSSFVAYKVKELGLRPLAVHFDSGWNSEISVKNIESIVKVLNIDLYTFVADWEEMRDLQLSFFKASVPDCDIPQDHGYLAALYRVAAQQNIHYIISGANIATEFVLPTSWGYSPKDLRHIKAIHRRFGNKKIRNYPTLGYFKHFVYYPYIKKIQVVRLLDYMPYSKREGKKLIQEKLNWQDYGGKHHESVFTSFFQAYYLPTKFGIDKRRAHLSSLIVSGELNRNQALEEMNQLPYEENRIQERKEYVAKKLGLTAADYDAILALPVRKHTDYPNTEWLHRIKRKFIPFI